MMTMPLFRSLSLVALFFGIAFSLAGALPAHAASPLAQLADRLEQSGIIHADFIQTKTLQALKRPLRTSGQIVFVRGEGVLWRIDKPYQASYALTPDTVTEVGPDGTRKVRPAREVPGLAQVGRVFEAIFQGNINSLEEHFDVTVSGNADHWRVELAPKPALKRFLTGINAQGGRFLDLIEVNEAQGDRTRIEFANPRMDALLSEADAHLLRNN
jgi:hypothetical protein